MCGLGQEGSMDFETRFLRFKMPVTLGSRFDDREVCRLGSWTNYKLPYLVMVMPVKK